ncbi:MAG TPA: hypothetical protein VGF82_25525 [Terracidiphilus sp.]|jgi:hypothetical protein
MRLFSPVLFAIVGVALTCVPVRAKEADEVSKSCPALTVTSVRVTEETVTGSDAPSEMIEVTSFPKQAAERHERTLIATGPVLGSMDSAAVSYVISCRTKGAGLIVTLTRSAEYHGNVLANVLWRPKVHIAIALHNPQIIFQMTFRMRLSTGEELRLAQTPPYRPRKYPLIVKQIIN